MIDNDRRRQKQEQKERVRRRMHVSVDPNNYQFYPAKKQTDYYDDDVHQRVGIYVRVSTDDVRQTTSYELQKKYYEDFVTRHPKWTLVEIYADEGISGTSLAHRDAFNKMIADAKAGKIDMIITKSVSRFARNVVITIGMVRDLAALRPPVGVFFESEAIFSLNDDSQMALSFVATMAEEESHTRSRSMETSLRMRLDNGIPLTPKLFGYTHDAEGNLIINPEEAPTVKLAYFMYLYGYSTVQIAKAFNALGRKSYFGNINWSSSVIVQILRNERHCGDVLTRKTFTENYRTHKTRKNRGERPQSRYLNHHEGIISREDFIAVQHMLDNAKYGNKSILPELRVVETGLFRGFVVANLRWVGFKEKEYFQASQSAYDASDETDLLVKTPDETEIEVEAGDFDLRGFEIARSEFFDQKFRPTITFDQNVFKFSAKCIQKLGEKNTVELLVNPITQKLAIRPTTGDNKNGFQISKLSNGKYCPREIHAAAFVSTLFSLLGWNTEYRYRIIGTLLEQDGEIAYVFDAENAQAYFKTSQIAVGGEDLGQRVRRMRAIPEEWTTSFGKEFYLHEQPLSVLESQSKADWKMRLQGKLVDTEFELKVTDFETIKEYIQKELDGIILEEDINDG